MFLTNVRGRLKAIAVTSLQRLSVFPELPTVSEAGVPGFEMDNFYGIYAPAGIPRPILLGLNRQISAIMNAPDMQQRVAADGAQVAPPATPASFKRKLAEEIATWEKFIKRANIKVEN